MRVIVYDSLCTKPIIEWYQRRLLQYERSNPLYSTAAPDVSVQEQERPLNEQKKRG